MDKADNTAPDRVSPKHLAILLYLACETFYQVALAIQRLIAFNRPFPIQPG